MPFIRACCSSKRCNGWIAIMGDTGHAALEAPAGERWQLRFFSSPARETGIHAPPDMLARFAHAYGRVADRDSFHARSARRRRLGRSTRPA